jgi:hypothetical protein
MFAIVTKLNISRYTNRVLIVLSGYKDIPGI